MNKTVVDKSKKYLKMFFLLLVFLMSSSFTYMAAIALGVDIADKKVLVILRAIDFIVITLVAILLYRKDLAKDWKKFQKTKESDMKIAFLYWGVGMLIMMSSNFLLAKAGLTISNNEQAVRQTLAASPLIAGLTTVILGPIAEELVFRHSFYSVFKNKVVFVLTSGLIFSGLHVIGSMNSYFDLLFMIPYSALGILFALTMVKTKTVYPSIFIHIWHNFLLTFINFLASGVIF